MRKVIVDEWLTLDGVAQAPGEKNEDTTGGSGAAVGIWITSMRRSRTGC
jgi:hypothetical protein